MVAGGQLDVAAHILIGKGARLERLRRRATPTPPAPACSAPLRPRPRMVAAVFRRRTPSNARWFSRYNRSRIIEREPLGSHVTGAVSAVCDFALRSSVHSHRGKRLPPQYFRVMCSLTPFLISAAWGRFVRMLLLSGTRQTPRRRLGDLGPGRARGRWPKVPCSCGCLVQQRSRLRLPVC